MAAKPTKKDLVDQIDEKIQALNLLKSALQGDRSRKPEMLEEYKQKFEDLLQVKTKKK
jgi:hypothetical protein